MVVYKIFIFSELNDTQFSFTVFYKKWFINWC